MGSLPPEFSLDFRPTTYVPKTVTDFLKEVSLIRNVSDKVSKLDSFINALQDEFKKIDAFKRELPLCMLLLNDAILYLKSEAAQCGAVTAVNNPPVLEEFMPLKKSTDDKNDDDQHSLSIKIEKDSNKDKKNWMSSVQLWNSNENPSLTATDSVSETKQNLKLEPEVVKKVTHQYTNGDAFQSCKSRNAARSFMPFKKYSGLSREEDSTNKGEELPIPGLLLLTPGIKSLREEFCSTGARVSCSRVVYSSATPNSQSNVRNGPQPLQQQTSRKQRRCWSPELHRRFVSALQQLGGSQAATPKQIRELMQVDGLTNDEVKSHLQKYRLHTRRVPSGTAATTPANQSVVVLGGSLWVSQGQDQYGDDLKGNSSGSPEGPLQLAGNTGGTSTTGGDSMEDDDDSKSEGYSWKSHIQGSGKLDV